MSVKMSGRYAGNKKIELHHEQSGTKIFTAAPLDNNGDGSSFSPTDLFTSSLAACMATIIAIMAEREGINIDGMRFELEKIMASDPRRVAGIPITFFMPSALDEKTRTKFERAALTCPVHKSIHPDIKIDLKFIYD